MYSLVKRKKEWKMGKGRHKRRRKLRRKLRKQLLFRW
jgi:hypothetical protein